MNSRMTVILAGVVMAAAPLVSAPAMAQSGAMHAQGAQAHAGKVMKTDARGRATQVEMNGRNYDVCTARTQDNCINPRAAGLKWGNRALDYWPGHPASEKADHPAM